MNSRCAPRPTSRNLSLDESQTDKKKGKKIAQVNTVFPVGWSFKLMAFNWSFFPRARTHTASFHQRPEQRHEDETEFVYYNILNVRQIQTFFFFVGSGKKTFESFGRETVSSKPKIQSENIHIQQPTNNIFSLIASIPFRIKWWAKFFLTEIIITISWWSIEQEFFFAKSHMRWNPIMLQSSSLAVGLFHTVPSAGNSNFGFFL